MTIRPIRLQLSRKPGFDLQAVSLHTNGLLAQPVARPTRWGNPFIVGKHGTRAECVDLFRRVASGHLCVSVDAECIEAQRSSMKALSGVGRLRGLNLACWCSGSPCHADVLLELANAEAPA